MICHIRRSFICIVLLPLLMGLYFTENSRAAAAGRALKVRFIDSATGYNVDPSIVTIISVSGAEPSKVLGSSQLKQNPVSSFTLQGGPYEISVDSPQYKPFTAYVDGSSAAYLHRFMLDPIQLPAELDSSRILSLHKPNETFILGFVVDDETGLPLAKVNVSCEPSGSATVTDDRGYFEFYVPSLGDSVSVSTATRLVFKKEGFEAEIREYPELFPGSDLIYQIRLTAGAGESQVDERTMRHRTPTPANSQSPVRESKDESAPLDWDSSLLPPPAAPIPFSSGSPTNKSVRVPRTIRILLTDNVTIDYQSLQNYCKHSLPAEWIAGWASYTGGSNSLSAGAVGIRTYAIGYINNPRTGNSSPYDICASTSCQVYNAAVSSAFANTAVDFTAGYVMVNASVRIPSGLTEYSAENNSEGFSCGDGYTQPTGGCIFDPVCVGETRNGHGRGMCQWGTAKWATGLKFPGNSTSNHTTTNGYPRQDWAWILTHYYPALSLVKGAELVVSDDVKVAGASVQVRMCGDGSISSGVNCALVTTKSVGSTGTIIGGPTQVTTDGFGYTWWKIQWSDSTVGWSPENWIERSIPLPAAPSGLLANAVSTSQINLSWTDNSGNLEDGFKLERAASSGGPWTPIITLLPGQTSYADTGLQPSTTYYYRVKAYNVSGDSSASSVSSAATPGVGPVLAAIPNKSVNEGSQLIFTNSATAPMVVQSLTDFEAYSSGTAVMFRAPTFSGSSVGIDPSPNVAAVTDTFPGGNNSGGRALNVNWSFNTTSDPNPWLRLTTASATILPNPVIDFTRQLRFEMYTDRSLKVGLGLRETTVAAGTAIGSNGGGAGGLEWAGVTGKNGNAPNPTRTIPGGAWTTVVFDLPNEPILNFVNGDGILSTASGLGVLEHIAFVPAAGTGAYNVYLDNFAVVQARHLNYSLDAGAPVGASVNPNTGVFTWTPAEDQGPGLYGITVRVTDDNQPPQNDAKSFNVLVGEVNQAPVLGAINNMTVHAGTLVAFTNSASDGDVPANALAYSLDPGFPSGASVTSGTGVFNWTPADSFAGTSNYFSMRVTDNGAPPLSSQRAFSVIVAPRPGISAVATEGGNIVLKWSAINGKHYRVQFKNDLTDASWTEVVPDVQANGNEGMLSTPMSVARRFYRIQVLD